jgi:hypothetical protein
MLWTVLAIAFAAIAFFAVYKAIHYFLPTWGTVLVNIVATLGFLVDFAATLPWGSVLDSREAALITFAGATMGNILARLNGKKPTVGSA